MFPDFRPKILNIFARYKYFLSLVSLLTVNKKMPQTTELSDYGFLADFVSPIGVSEFRISEWQF
jgi:hypothetical protein